MTNPFSNDSLVPTWTVATEILKGDVPDHEFHGNQYSHIGDAVKELGNKLNGRTPTGRRGTPAQMAKLHNVIAEMHREAAKRDTNGTYRSEHIKAAIAHERAAAIQRDPSQHEAVAVGRVVPTLGRQLATADAIDASRETPQGRTTSLTQADISHFNDLYDKGLI